MSWWLLWVLCCASWIERSSQVFRFCHRGVWHQLQEQDCPHGLLFNEQLQTPCFYTQGEDHTLPRIWPTLCQRPYVNHVENATDATPHDQFFLAHKNGQIRMVQYGITDDNAVTTGYEEVISLQSCEDRCYRNVFEPSRSSQLYTSSSHEASDSLESHRYYGSDNALPPHLTTAEIAAVTDQTLRLGDYLFEQIVEPDDNPGPNLRMVELYKRSMRIMGKACQHPFVSRNFVNRVLYGFLFLVSDSGIGELEDVSVEEFEEIMVALNGCDEKEPDFRLEGTVCDLSAVVKEVVKVLPNGTEYTAPFQLTQAKRPDSDNTFRDPDYEDEGKGRNPQALVADHPFPFHELDIFTEAAWTAVQVTHASCFATFKPNANMHHRYVAAMEQLFSGKILDRWRNPTRLIDDRMWGTWFLADVSETFTNLQACIRAAYLDAPFSMRLDRPIDAVRTQDKLRPRTKREIERFDPELYWDQYEAAGGIRYKLAEEVHCFQNPEERDPVVHMLQEQCKV